MTAFSLEGATVLVVGAGIMGMGIAQVAAQAGHSVRVYDSRDGAAAEAKRKLAANLDGLVAKGKLRPQAVQDTLARIEPIGALAQASDCTLVVEAIVENLAVKRGLLQQLEAIVASHCVLATNTSSISVTALANGLAHPQRLVGMHFFNPVPLMKLVEVVSGLRTSAAVAEAVYSLAEAWGKVPVHTASTPGFIVNRIARPYYAETLALLQERAAEPQVLDACLRAAGFRMGPCELMDLIGHDTNFAVTSSVYEANFFDKRFVPSLVQRELVDGGLLGRKSGQGFYRYGESIKPPGLPAPSHESVTQANEVSVHGTGPIADALAQAAAPCVAAWGGSVQRVPASDWVGLAVDGARLVLSEGRPAHELAALMRCNDVAVFDRPLVLPVAPSTALAYAVAQSAGPAWQEQAPAWLAALGFVPCRMADAPGLVVTRTLAMLINEAADAVQQAVCTPAAADVAMKLGVNYPAGPFEWLAAWGAQPVMAALEALDAHYRGERYRVSPWLRRG